MKKLLLILLFSTTIAKSQSTVKTYYDPLFRTKIKEVYEVKPNSPTIHGKYTSYDQYGNKLKVCYYDNNVQHGKSTTYYGADEASILPDNIKDKNFRKVSGVYNYSNGNLNGNQTQYIYDSKGQKHIKIEKKYDNGKEIYSVEYYLNNKIKKKQQITGLCFTNDENGNKTEEYHLLNNEYNGKYSSYYENGNIYVTGNYEKGNRIGVWIENFENGTLKTKNTYEGDLLVQQQTSFSNGKLKWEMNKINDYNYIEKTYDSVTNNLKIKQEFKLFGTTKKAHGTKEYFNPSINSIIKIENFKNGNNTLVLKEFYDNSNLKKEVQKTSPSKLIQATYYPNKQIESFLNLTIRNSGEVIKDGEAFYYYTNSKVKETGQYSSNQKKGTWKYYNKEGKLEFIEKENHLYKRIKKNISEIEDEENQSYIFTNISIFREKKKEIKTLYTIEDKFKSKILGSTVYKKDKQNLYKAYEIVLTNVDIGLKNNDLSIQKESLELGIKLTRKMEELRNSDTKKLEKSLKKVTNPIEIRTALGI